MPPSGTVLSNLNEVVFNKGYMFGTISGHTSDAIQFGALQNVALAHTYGTAELSGPESLAPLAVGITGETLEGSFEHGVIHPEQYIMMTGGSMVASGANTVYTKKIAEEPLPFDLHVESGPTGLDDVDLVLYNCLCPSWSLRLENRAFVIGSGNFRVYGQSDANGGKLFVMTKPGNLTNSS